MLSILLILCMLLTLLPTTALASGNDTGMAMATNHEELVSALNDSTIRELTIYPRWPIDIQNNEYEYYTWPEGEVTLNMDAVNLACDIYLENGTWNCMSNQAIIGNVYGGEALYGALTVNGTLAVDKDLRGSPVQVGSFTLNGTLENAGVCYINNMTMANVELRATHTKTTSVTLTEDMTAYVKWTEKAGENPFTDVSGVAYYADAVIWAVGEGITSGTTAITFSPNATCTRAQIVTFLFRCLRK